jgi:hypothetical protein
VNHKVLNPVVGRLVIPVMHNLPVQQTATKGRFHHKDVLKYVAILPRPRMIWLANKHVPLAGLNVAPTLPIRVHGPNAVARAMD